MYSSLLTTLTLNPAVDRTVTIRNFRAGEVNRVAESCDRAGGKGINVAAALAAHGHAVAALGFLGRDNDAIFKAFFAAHAIEDRCVRLPGETRTGIKVFDPVSNETTDINFPGLSPSAAELDALRGQVARLAGGWCALAGSLPPGVEPGFYREVIEALRVRGVRAMLDTSGEALREGLRAGPDIVKPNVHELEAVTGRALPTEDDVVEAARAWLAAGVKLVAVSRGADGACFVTADDVVIARPPTVAVRSTVGAGDAMVAGIVAAQVRGLGLVECARQATAYSLAALTGGASEGFVGRVEVEVRRA